MNPHKSSRQLKKESSILIEITIDEYWIDQFLFESHLEIPVNEKLSLTNLRINLEQDSLKVQADLKNKKTTIELTSRPVWNAEKQYFTIEDLKIETNSKSVVLKSAGWIAQNFLNAKIDRKIEEVVNKILTQQLVKLKENPVQVPGPRGGTINILVSNMTIDELDFQDKAIHAKAKVKGFLKIHFS